MTLPACAPLRGLACAILLAVSSLLAWPAASVAARGFVTLAPRQAGPAPARALAADPDSIPAARPGAASPATPDTASRAAPRPATPASPAGADSIAATSAGGSRVADPLYELLIGFAENDSLGSWDQAYLRRAIERSGRRCMLPYQEIVRIVRRLAVGAEAERRRGAQVSRIWEITLEHPVNVPMPYSFLGYHPGSLLASRRFVASEWRLGTRVLYVARGHTVDRFPVEGTIVFRLDQGYIALDVDAWLDKLLGSLLDDFYTDGFAICRYRGGLWESSLITTRNGRPDYGEFDFGSDRVIEHLEKLSRALGHVTRPWVAPHAGRPARGWPRPEESP